MVNVENPSCLKTSQIWQRPVFLGSLTIGMMISPVRATTYTTPNHNWATLITHCIYKFTLVSRWQPCEPRTLTWDSSVNGNNSCCSSIPLWCSGAKSNRFCLCRTNNCGKPVGHFNISKFNNPAVLKPYQIEIRWRSQEHKRCTSARNDRFITVLSNTAV